MALARLTTLLCAVAFVAAAPVTETQFVASATPTHFAASNPNDYAVLMILGDVAHGARAQMLVAPHAQFETSFPSGTLSDLYIEVVFFAPTGWRSSGSVSFDTMLTAQSELLEVEDNGDQLQPWIYTSTGRLPADSGMHLAPSSLINSGSGSTPPMMLDPAHVPVITPEEINDNTAAPKILGPNPTV